MISMARFTVRKDFQGNVISETIERLPDDPGPELTYLGNILAEKLRSDSHFREFCTNYQRSREGAKLTG